VQAKNGHVVVGASGSASPQDDAFAQYAAFLGGGAAATAARIAGDRALAGTIDRIATAPTGTVYLTLRGTPGIFTLDAHDAPAALLARPGDRVQFKRGAATGGFAAISGFSDAALLAAAAR